MTEFFSPLAAFVFLGLFSPGPNVILLTASGARFGFVKTVPHIVGVAFGVGITAAITALGVAAFLTSYPSFGLVLKCISCGWILYMAFRLWNADLASHKLTDARPFSFVEAALFQWVNPKVWAVALSATAFVTEQSPVQQAIELGSLFTSLNFGVCIFWTFAGSVLSYLLNNPFAWRVFMRSMAVMLVGFSVMIFL